MGLNGPWSVGFLSYNSFAEISHVCQSKCIWILHDLRKKFGEEETKHLQHCAWLGKVMCGYNKKELWETPFQEHLMLQKAASQRWLAWFLRVMLGREVEELKTPRECFVIMSCAVATKQSHPLMGPIRWVKGDVEERWTRPRGKGQIGHRWFGRKDPWWLWRLQ